MKALVSTLVAFIALSLVMDDADARRLGGGRNIGTQRSITQQPAPKAPAQQQQAQPQQQQQAAPAAPAPQPSGMSKWLGPLAGLALGAGLAALFFNNGAAGLLAGLLMIAAIVAVAVFAARALRGKVAQQPLQYAGASGAEPPLAALPGGAGTHSVAATAGRWPAEFDAADFARNARLNFVRMQEAHDQRDLTAMRDFLTPEVYREVEADIRAAGAEPCKTEVLTLNAEVLEVATEGDAYIVSVRFSGLIREQAEGNPEPFSEVWHLEKPVSGRSGWLVAGIQQD